jgi:Reeler domain
MLKLKGKQKLQAALLILVAAAVAYARVTGPEPGYTGAPREIGNCTACHDHPGQPDVGPGSVRVDGVPQVYQPGQVYPLNVTVQQGGRQRFGFQLTAIDGSDKKAGTLQSPTSDSQVIAETGFGDRQYVEHTQIGTVGQGNRTWQIRWTAPSSDVGTVRFFVAGNAADGDGTNQGNDYIYLSSASSDSPTSFVTVLLQSHPDGQTLSPGSKYTISWNVTGASNIDNIEVRYSTNNGADNFPFANQIFFTTDPSVTSVDWTVPNLQTSQAVVRVKVGKKSGSAIDLRSGLFTISGSGGPPAPIIFNASVSGKKLYVTGENFAEGASIYTCSDCSAPATDGKKAKKVSNDSDLPTTLLVSKKAGKDIERGSAVKIQIKNPDGTLSEPFLFTRPLQ